MKYKGTCFEIKRNYFKKLAFGRQKGRSLEITKTSTAGNPQVKTLYSDMPHSLRISTFQNAGQVQSGPVTEAGFLGEVQLASSQIKPVENQSQSAIFNIIDPLDDVLLKIHDCVLKTIPEKLYDAELRLRSWISPLVKRGIIPIALVLLFINSGCSDDGSVPPDKGQIMLETWKWLLMGGLNSWMVASWIGNKLPDDILGKWGIAFVELGKHLAFKAAMIGNFILLGQALSSTEYLNPMELIENYGTSRIFWSTLLFFGVLFPVKTWIDYLRTRYSLYMNPHGTRLNHIATHAFSNFSMATKFFFISYRILMFTVGAFYLFQSLALFSSDTSQDHILLFTNATLNLFFATWLLLSDIHMSAHPIVFHEQQRYSLVGERYPLISDRFKDKISGPSGPSVMVQKPHFFPNEGAFAGFFTTMINEYCRFQLLLETDVPPYGNAKNIRSVNAGYEMRDWIRGVQGCVRNIVFIPYYEYHKVMTDIRSTEDQKQKAHNDLIDGLISVNETLSALYGEEGVDISALPLRGDHDREADRLFAQSEGRVTLFGIIPGHFERDRQRVKDGRPSWFYAQGELPDPRFQMATRKETLLESVRSAQDARLLRRSIERIRTSGGDDAAVRREITVDSILDKYRRLLRRFEQEVDYVVRKADKNNDKKPAKITNVSFVQSHAADTLYAVWVHDPKRQDPFYEEFIPSTYIKVENPRYNFGAPSLDDGRMEPRYLWIHRGELSDLLEESTSASNEIAYVDNPPPSDAEARDIFVRIGNDGTRRRVRAFDIGNRETSNTKATLIFRAGEEQSLDGCNYWVAANTKSNGLSKIVVVNKGQDPKFEVSEGQIEWYIDKPQILSINPPHAYLMNDSEHVDISTPRTSGAILERDSHLNKVLRIMSHDPRSVHFPDPAPERDASEISDITWVDSDLGFLFHEIIGTIADTADTKEGRCLTPRNNDVVAVGGRLIPWKKISRKGTSDLALDTPICRVREVPFDIMRHNFPEIQATPRKEMPLDSRRVSYMEARKDEKTNEPYLLIHYKGLVESVRLNIFGNKYSRFLPHPEKILKGRVELLAFTERLGTTAYLRLDYGEGYENPSDRFRFVRTGGRLCAFSTERITKIKKRGGFIFIDSTMQKPIALPLDRNWTDFGNADNNRFNVINFDNGGEVWFGKDPIDGTFRWAPTEKEAQTMGLEEVRRPYKGSNLLRVTYTEGGTQRKSDIPIETRLCGWPLRTPRDIAGVSIVQSNGDAVLQADMIDKQYLFEIDEGHLLPPEVSERFGFVQYIELTRKPDGSGGVNINVYFNENGVKTGPIVVDGNTFHGFNNIGLPDLETIYQDKDAAILSTRDELRLSYESNGRIHFRNLEEANIPGDATARVEGDNILFSIQKDGVPIEGTVSLAALGIPGTATNFKIQRVPVYNEYFEFGRHPSLFSYEGRIYLRFNTCSKPRSAPVPKELQDMIDRGVDLKSMDIRFGIVTSAVKLQDVKSGRTEWVPVEAKIHHVDLRNLKDNAQILKLTCLDPENPSIRNYVRMEIAEDARNIRIEKGRLIYETGHLTGKAEEHTVDVASYRGNLHSRDRKNE